jgi:predicted molibdopterin-dependent oxidoreductase YjgC
VEVNWDEALAFVKTQTDSLKSKLAGSGFFGLIGDACSNEEIYAFQRLMRRVIGTNNVDHRLTRKRRLSPSEKVNQRGVQDYELQFKDIEDADIVLVFGSDLHSENPITALRVKKAIRKHDARLILANPRPTPLGIRAADKEIIYKPGTEVPFILGLIDAVIASPGLELGVLGLEMADIEKFKKQHSQYGREQAATLCGVDVQVLEDIADLLNGAKRVVIISGQEVRRHAYRDSIFLALSNLVQLCESADHLPMPANSNSRGAEIFGAQPDLLPGHTAIEDKKRFEDVWKGPIPDLVGKDTIGILDAIGEDEIECGFIFGTDPVRTFPDGKYVKSILEGLQLMIVIDSFMTDTARIADVILPLSTFAETDGTRVNWEGRLQVSRQAVSPMHSSKPGCEIIELLADRLGVQFDQGTTAGVYREMRAFLPAQTPESLEQIDRQGVLLHVAERRQKMVSDLVEIKYTPLPEDDEYPLVLLVGNADHHRGTLTEKNESLMGFTGEPFVGLSKNEADKLSVADGDLVRVESRHGKVVGKAVILSDFADGQVLVPENFSELQPSLLMGHHDKSDLVKLSKM